MDDIDDTQLSTELLCDSVSTIFYFTRFTVKMHAFFLLPSAPLLR